MKGAASGLLVSVFILAMCAGWMAPYAYDSQQRGQTELAPGAGHWLGTDELGRDRFSRLWHGARISLLLAPASAAAATLLAAAAGLVAGYLGGWIGRLFTLCTDVFLGLPWLFLLLAVRAALPLNLAPAESLLVTGALMGGLGWAPAARVMRESCARLRGSSFLLQAEAAGQSPARILFRHAAPHLRPMVLAQFLQLAPAFLLAEANLGMLGLGVTEPLPSLGNLMAELASLPSIPESPGVLAPAVLLVLVLCAFQLAMPAVRASS